MMRSVIVVVLTGFLFCSGCRTLDPEPSAVHSISMPNVYSMPAGDHETIENFWHILDSDELNSLIKDALDQNYDLNALKTRIVQAQARVKKEEASFFPDLGFSLGGQKKGIQSKKKTGSDTTFTGSHSFDSSLSSSYAVDVFGEARADKKAEESSLLSAEEELRNAAHELTAQIAGTWIDIIATRTKKNIVDNQIKINETLLDLQKLRYANGKAKALDVSQQKEALAEANAQIPLLEKQEKLLLNTLAFLTGKTLSGEIDVAARNLPDSLPVPATGIPARLLENRPDIKAARLRLSSSEWEVKAAGADLLPSFKITAQALFSSGELDLLFRNWVATLAASIAGPIFDGGFRRAELERVRAVAEEQLHLYTKTVAKAVTEVENSLVSLEKQKDYIALLEEELGLAKLTLKDAMIQYRNGQSSYLAYLVAWTGLERLERELAGERAIYIKEWIDLHRALGWHR